MKADKPLEWRQDETWGRIDHIAHTEFHGWGEEYRVMPPNGRDNDGNYWSVSGVPIPSRFHTLDDARQRAQDDYNRKRRLKAWEDYMLTHEVPNDHP